VEVVHTDEFREWWDGLSEDEQEDVARVVDLLRGAGVLLSFPHSSALKQTKQPLRELRPRRGASPLRVVYAFDPKRDAVLLIGSDKGSDARFTSGSSRARNESGRITRTSRRRACTRKSHEAA
jgi:hypothetical protein